MPLSPNHDLSSALALRLRGVGKSAKSAVCAQWRMRKGMSWTWMLDLSGQLPSASLQVRYLSAFGKETP